MTDPAQPPATSPSETNEPDTHTGRGAPTDAAHAADGDGSTAGSTPAGLTADELLEQANKTRGVDGGTG